ncbi:hypothetical protein EON65_31565 [archaeon]|nr:MAG: hypothetical protein EON65_31565 [archaeon]
MSTVKLLGSNRFESAQNVMYNPSEDCIYAVGQVNGGSYNGEYAQGSGNIAVYKISNAGALVWSTVRGGSDSNGDVAYGIALDNANGQVWVMGQTSTSLNGQMNMGGSFDMAVMLVGMSIGGELSTKLFGTVGFEQIVSGCLSSSGSLIIGGSSNGALDGMQYNGGTSLDGYVKKLKVEDLLPNINKWSRVGGQFTADAFYSVTEDTSGNVYATGYVNGGVHGASAFGGSDVVVVKYSSTGDRQWTKIYGSTGADIGRTIEFQSSDGFLYVAGHASTGFNGLTTAGTDFYLMRLSTAGDVMLTRIRGNSADDMCNDMAIGPDGSFYIVGFTASSNSDIYLVKYSSSLTFVQAQTYGSSNSANDYGSGITVDSSGNVYVAGSTLGTWNGVASVAEDILLLKISASTGSLVSSRLFSTTSADYAYDVVFDAANSCLYVSCTVGASFDGLTYYGTVDTLLLKLDLNFNIMFNSQIGSTADERTTSMCVDTANDVIWVMGYTYGHLNSQFNKNKGNLAYDDTMLMAFHMNGNVLDTRVYGLGKSYDTGWGCRVTSSGSYLYLVGQTTGSFDGKAYNGDSLIPNWDFYLKKIDIASSFNLYSASKWTRHVSSTGNEVVTDILTDSAGNVYAIGYVNAALHGTATSGGNDVFVVKYSATGLRLDTRLVGTTVDDYPLGAVLDPSQTYMDLGVYSQETGGHRLRQYRLTLDSLTLSVLITGTDLSPAVAAYTEDFAGNAYFAGVDNNDVRLWRYDSTAALTYRQDFANSGTER